MQDRIFDKNLSCLAAILFAACSHQDALTKPADHPVSENPMPSWVQKGAGSYPGEKGKLFAAGIAPSGIDDEGMSRTSAEEDGRVRLQRVFETYVVGLFEGYKQATIRGGKGVTDIDQKEVTRTLTEGTMRGSQVVDHWQNPKNGTWYALIVLDMSALKEILADKRDLDEGVKAYIRDNAERAQDDLDARLAEKSRP